jgi:hypothetical protein
MAVATASLPGNLLKVRLHLPSASRMNVRYMRDATRQMSPKIGMAPAVLRLWAKPRAVVQDRL